MPCDTEEADDCLLLHTIDVLKSFDRIFIKTSDSDIVTNETARFLQIPIQRVMDHVLQSKSINLILICEIVSCCQ